MCRLVIQSLELLRTSDISRDNNDFYDRETLQRHVFVVFVGHPLPKCRRNNLNKKNTKDGVRLMSPCEGVEFGPPLSSLCARVLRSEGVD